MDDIIDDCLGRLLLGETIEECVNLYPDHELHLRTLLEAAEPTINTISSVSFRSTAKTRGLQKLMDMVGLPITAICLPDRHDRRPMLRSLPQALPAAAGRRSSDGRDVRSLLRSFETASGDDGFRRMVADKMGV